jgi:hypothetical protein
MVARVNGSPLLWPGNPGTPAGQSSNDLGGVEVEHLGRRKDPVRAELEIVTQARHGPAVCSDHHGIDAATGQRMEHTVGGTSRRRIP